MSPHRRSVGCCLALLSCALVAMPLAVSADKPAWKVALENPEQRDGQRDFDWLMGKWKIRIKRLVRPLTGSTTWVEYQGISTVSPIWNGKATLDEVSVQSVQPNPPLDAKLEALTLRLYNPKTRLWSLYYANAKFGVLGLPATVGSFRNGVGEFYDEEEFEGRPIVVRFIWSDITPTSAHFEQSFSVDGGKTWEPNWIADITRLTVAVSFVRCASGSRCQTPTRSIKAMNRGSSRPAFPEY